MTVHLNHTFQWVLCWWAQQNFEFFYFSIFVTINNLVWSAWYVYWFENAIPKLPIDTGRNPKEWCTKNMISLLEVPVLTKLTLQLALSKDIWILASSFFFVNCFTGGSLTKRESYNLQKWRIWSENVHILRESWLFLLFFIGSDVHVHVYCTTALWAHYKKTRLWGPSSSHCDGTFQDLSPENLLEQGITWYWNNVFLSNLVVISCHQSIHTQEDLTK